RTRAATEAGVVALACTWCAPSWSGGVAESGTRAGRAKEGRPVIGSMRSCPTRGALQIVDLIVEVVRNPEKASVSAEGSRFEPFDRYPRRNGLQPHRACSQALARIVGDN